MRPATMHHTVFLPAAGRDELPCLLALPPGSPGLPRPAGPLPLVISVHGFTRQPLEHAAAMAPPVLARGWALLVPVFDERRHRRYQQLLHPRRGTRSDLALINLVERLAPEHGLARSGWGLFGFSAGAQFAHRFALRHPDRLAALGVGAAGWYTWPDPTRVYPQGWGGLDTQLGGADPAAFLRLPLRLWVGERDDGPDRHFRESADLSAWQGGSRLARAENWAQALAAAGRAQAPEVTRIPRAGHSFTACDRRGRLAEEVTRFFGESLSQTNMTI